jgi:CubicO group peptidase (beta-lactamase class C family)
MPRLIRRVATLAAAFAATIALSGCDRLNRAAGVPVYYVSHQLCSAVFVAGLDPGQFYREAIAPEIVPVSSLIHYDIDRANRAVTASLAGIVHSRAVYRGPLGCQVEHGAEQPQPDIAVASAASAAPPLLPPIAGPDVVEPADPALKAALDRAFAEPAEAPHRYTKAVVILHDGRIVAERYAPGIGIRTPLLGWSMTKSVTNALIGILVREGKVAVDRLAPIPAWSDPSDPRHAITIDNLLRMTSGLAIGQSLTSDWRSAFDPSAQMNFDMADEAAFAEQAKLAVPPGAEWKYTNGNTILLCRIIRDQVGAGAGGDAAAVYRFAHRELFDKLGMAHVTLEFDAAGTPIGSNAMWASARDWARFGMLYLNDGVVNDGVRGGERILPAGWVDYSARPTPQAAEYGYGAGFWTNRGARSGGALRRVRAGMPADSFMARGTQGQYVVVVPSAKLVVVRLGFAETPLGDIAATERLVADAVAAVTAPAQQRRERARASAQ